MNVHCVNPDCAETGIVKSLDVDLVDDEHVSCGVCGDDLVDDAGTVVVGPFTATPPDQGAHVEARLDDLEAFDEALIDVLAGYFAGHDPALADQLRDLVG